MIFQPVARGTAAGAKLIFTYFVYDTSVTTGAGLTGKVYSDFTCKYQRQGEALSGAITPQSIAAIGTYAAPTANTNIRLGEISATAPDGGWYEMQCHLDWFATTNTPAWLRIDLTVTGGKIAPIIVPLALFDGQLIYSVNVTQIDGNATNGNNATLNLKQLNIVNNAADAVIFTSSSAGNNGLNITGNTTGSGVKITGGASGNGMTISGGATQGHGISTTGTGTSFNGLYAVGSTTTGNGILAIGGGTSGDGIKATSTSGNGMTLAGGTAGHGLSATGAAAGDGILATGGNSATTGGIVASGGAATANGIYALGNTSGNGILANGGNSATTAGLKATGGASGAHGVYAAGNAAGDGALLTGGNSATTGGLVCTGQTTLANGIWAQGNTAGHGIRAQGGTTAAAAGLSVEGGATNATNGLRIVGGSTSGVGLVVTTTSGDAATISAGGGNGRGLLVAANGTGIGLQVTGGGTSGDAVSISSTSGNGMTVTGGGTTGHGASFTRGGASGHDVNFATPDVTIPLVTTTTTATTATNLTNAPTNGDFTATMKTSLNSATPASITGNVGGNVTGSVGSIAAGGITDASYGTATVEKAIRTNTAQAGAAGSITLDSGASATDDLYEGTVIKITSGTGVGQCRLIINYVGSSKIAYVNHPWNVNPDNTSVFVITQATMPTYTTTGLAAAGGASTLTLASTASATDNFYDGGILYVVGGTGAGQSKIVGSYVGATKVATVTEAWAVTPDTTSVYMFTGLGDVEVGINNDKTGYSLAANQAVNVTQVDGASLSTHASGMFPADARDILGTAISTPATAGILDVNIKNMNNVAATSITTINANQGTTQPVNFTGTAGTAYVKSDMVDIAGAAVSTSTAQIGVNAVQIGAAVPGSATIGTVTNLTNAPTAGDLTSTMKTSVENAVWEAATASHQTAGTEGKALSNAGSAADPWSTAIPGAYGAGTAGNIVGNNLNAKVGDVKTQTDKMQFDGSNNIKALKNATDTAGVDFSATEKTSITTAATAATPTAAAVTGAVGSVTGNVGGNVVGSVASVTGNVGGNVTGSVGTIAANGITSTSIATDAINANSVKADAVTKIQNGLATPTNITAGTITTVTNLTNAPTAGDFTATMKTSLNAATPTVTVSGTPTVNVTQWSGSAVATPAIAGEPVVTLAATQAAYAPSKAGDKMDIVDSPNTTALQQFVNWIDNHAPIGVSNPNSLIDVIDAVDIDVQNCLTTSDFQAFEAAIQPYFTHIDSMYNTGVNAKQIGASTTAANNIALSGAAMIPGTVTTAGFASTTTQFECSDITDAVTDHYIGRIIIFTSGTLIRQACLITAYSLISGRGHFTVNRGVGVTLTSAPANGVTLIVI